MQKGGYLCHLTKNYKQQKTPQNSEVSRQESIGSGGGDRTPDLWIMIPLL